MNRENGWYIVKNDTGNCEILADTELQEQNLEKTQDSWGPFTSKAEAISRRVGLIRSGKCEPV